MVYGDGWRQKVAEYKEQKQHRAGVQMASATAEMLAGGVLFVTALVFLIFRIIAGGIGRTIKAVANTDGRMLRLSRAGR